MPTVNNISFYKGEAIQVTWTMSPAVDVAGYTITLRVRGERNSFTKTPATLLAPTTNGQFQFTLTHADTMPLLGLYTYDVQRVDSGVEAWLSLGTMTVLD